MSKLKGKRKFIIVLFSLSGALILSTITILNSPDQAVGIIGAIGGTITAITIPFMAGNYGEHKSQT